MAEDDRDTITTDFAAAVNMTRKQLETWLDTEQSQSVGMTGSGEKKSGSGGAESKGHQSGREIVRLLAVHKADLSADDLTQMKRVTGYVHRHLAQGPPKADVETSRWRYSLMNWGHDPLKQ